ncbi:transmembrane protein 208-like [Oscarella lobularis]|uniref:transmembrane protein 208-like n=1 Tax=Oscarella lobularis TaxID=121494 RepID=UPI003313A14A
MPSKKPTKGKKEIVEANKQTLSFYFRISMAANAVYVLIRMLLMYDSFSLFHWFGLAGFIVAHGGGNYLLQAISRSTYSEAGVLIQAGMDLNMGGGLPEYCKDIVIFATGIQGLTIISDVFWLLIFLVPVYIVYSLWTPLIQPWLTAGSQPLDEPDSKAAKKMARRERRQQQGRIVYK